MEEPLFVEGHRPEGLRIAGERPARLVLPVGGFGQGLELAVSAGELVSVGRTGPAVLLLLGNTNVLEVLLLIR